MSQNVDFQYVAEQLRKPFGEDGVKIAERLSIGNRAIYSNSLASLKLNPEDRVLEVGMANGAFVEDIIRLATNVEYVGLDFSEIMVEEASRSNAEFAKSHSIKFEFGDVEDLRFHDQTFDAAVTINTVYFWEDLDLALANLHRVLKPDGQLVVGIRPKRVMEHYPFAPFGFRMFTADQLSESMAQAGFAITDVNEYEEESRIIDGQQLEVASLVVRGVKSSVLSD